MKKLLSVIICIMLLSLCGCNNADATPDEISANSATQSNAQIEYDIVGTWVCDDISEDVYFIFSENGDAYAKWGSCTVYGYFDYDDESNLYDIDVPNLLFNEYEAIIDGDELTLKSETSKFEFESATMPEIVINAPDNLAIDDTLLGNWQSADNFECYEFCDDGTAIITDMYNYATTECKFSCNDGVVTFYYMSSATLDGTKELSYSITDENNIVIDNYNYENVTVE